MDRFKLVSKYVPTGDQPDAIKKLTDGVLSGNKAQTLLGVTGSGKTFTMANVIQNVNRPTLVIAHNKTLAAQLCSEFREFFPENSVEFFVSYYDYYQPEAYIAASDTYIEKDAQINDEIDRLRHSATAALFERRDVIIVASVSCIYGLGDPEDYTDLMVSLRPGMTLERDRFIAKLVEIRYERNNLELKRNCFRVRGDTVELIPSDMATHLIRIEFWGDEIDKMTEIDAVTGEIIGTRSHVAIFPASHYATTGDKLMRATDQILEDMKERVEYFNSIGKPVEAYRIEQRTRFDVEMMRETGFCQGIENYSRYISGRAPGVPPYTLIDYFPKDFLLMIDESHVTVPQIRAMYNGDKARKTSLVDYGFRLPSAFDNRPLNFSEFNSKINQVIYVSATPADYERGRSSQIAEQVIRPTGLPDPEIVVRPVDGQIDDLIGEIRTVTARGSRVLVTTLTKKMAESLTDYLSKIGIKVRYLHSDVKTTERMEIVRDLRLGEFDVLVGINLLREGLDLPEVSLVAILDADKEGFLRSETSLIQTVGRAARNAEGRVIMYADEITDSMARAIAETNRRRKLQTAYNEAHGITPKTIEKNVAKIIESMDRDEGSRKLPKGSYGVRKTGSDAKMTLQDAYRNASRILPSVNEAIAPETVCEMLEDAMREFAADLEFELAAKARDMLRTFRKIMQGN
ncbi:MAG: excinuclease ABC subunit UvrB [Clostridia bacterium]|nr:excinuclease ABC subunit UvrB [Clostridia bacterium]